MGVLNNIRIAYTLMRWNIHNMTDSHFRLQENPLYLNDVLNNISIFRFISNTSKNIFRIYSPKRGFIIHVTDFNSAGLLAIAEKLDDLGARRATIEFCNFYRERRTNTGPFFLANIEQEKRIFERLSEFAFLKNDFSTKGTFANIIKNLDVAYETTIQQSTRDKKFSQKAPTHIFLELTQNCNLSCRMCGRRAEKFTKDKEMDFELFKKIGKQLFKKGAFVDLRGYGESTYYSKFLDVIEYAKKFDCDFGIVTNLTTQDKKVLKKMVEADFWIQISFDGATKKTFEHIRRGSNFGNVLKSLSFISEYKRKIGSKSSIEFIITIQGNNIHELMDICKIAAKFKLDRVVFNPVVTNENDPNNLKYHKDLVKKIVPKAIRYVKSKGIKAQIISSFDMPELEKELKVMTECPRPYTWIYVDYTGRIGPCNHFMEKDYTFGSLGLKDNDVLKERNNLAFQFLRSVINTKYRLSSCEYCFKRRYDY